jgi:indolepyruvate ferredoxin oxidoreductase, alpha subunit
MAVAKSGMTRETLVTMAEVSFHGEIESLRLGAGETFYGEGILAVTKALLQSGVSYVGGYQGAPVSHLLDALVQSEALLTDLGIHLETCTNEAAAAAMLAASINYPLRGAITWKSIVGTNVAADALSNLASPGVQGGALIIVGEDYGEGASVIQERTHAFALKSSLWLLDPRPDLPSLVRSVEKGFELSEASNTPVILELRVRACHIFGSFSAKDNVAAAHSANSRLGAAPFNYERLSHPPATFRQEVDKVERRLPAARRFIVDNKLNQQLGPAAGTIGIIVQGGLFNVLNGRLALADLSDINGAVGVPTLILNVVHPLVPEEITSFCAGKSAVLVVEEGAPDFIEQAIGQILRNANLETKLSGKDVLPMAGEYTPLVVGKGLATFLARHDRAAPALEQWIARVEAQRAEVGAQLTAPLPARPPTFCTGCPERPVFSAMKLLRREMGPVHISADIGCHSFATFAPFSQGNSILGYGMSLAAAAAVSATQAKRPIRRRLAGAARREQRSGGRGVGRQHCRHSTHGRVRTRRGGIGASGTASYLRPLTMSAPGAASAKPLKLPGPAISCAMRMKPPQAERASAPPTLMRRTPSSVRSRTVRALGNPIRKLTGFGATALTTVAISSRVRMPGA